MKQEHDELLRQPGLDGAITHGAGEDAPSKVEFAGVIILLVLVAVGFVLPVLWALLQRGLRLLARTN